MENPDDLVFLDEKFPSVYNEQIEISDSDIVLLDDISESEPDNEDDVSMDNSADESVEQRRPTHSSPIAGTSRLPQPTIEWTNVTNNDPGPTRTIPIFNVNSGTNLPHSFDKSTSPVEYFLLFFNEELREHIIKETNICGNKRKNSCVFPKSRLNRWTEIDDKDLKAFLGTIINMGLIPLPKIESYFSRMWESRIPFFPDIFSQRDFMNIFWNLHFNHGGNSVKPKNFLIEPIVSHMKSVCKTFYTPGNFVSVDESTIPFKEEDSFRAYNPQKPTKCGMKVFVLSDSENGYIYDFIPYFGKEDLIPNSPLLKTTQIVKLLAQSIIMKDPCNPTTGLHIYTDSYYTSPELASELLDLDTYLTGKVTTTRKDLPINMKQRTKTLKRNEILAERKANILVISWREKKVVNLLSTKSKGSINDMTIVPTNPPTAKPNVFIDYMKHMGGVDRSDRLTSSYQFKWSSKKWYHRMFFWLLEVAIVNSFILYKEVQKQNRTEPLSHLDFRKSLVRDLVAERIATKPEKRKTGLPPTGPEEERLRGRHFLTKRDKKWARCVVCLKKGLRRETGSVCKTCTGNPHLHPHECFEEYHTKANF